METRKEDFAMEVAIQLPDTLVKRL
jgi:hypothetical protein